MPKIDLQHATKNPAAPFRPAPGERLRRLEFPDCLVIVDEFKVVTPPAPKGKNTFIVVSHPLYQGQMAVAQWITERYPGNWIVPVIKFAGEEWALNPKYSDDGWQWLFMRIGG